MSSAPVALTTAPCQTFGFEYPSVYLSIFLSELLFLCVFTSVFFSLYSFSTASVFTVLEGTFGANGVDRPNKVEGKRIPNHTRDRSTLVSHSWI